MSDHCNVILCECCCALVVAGELISVGSLVPVSVNIIIHPGGFGTQS